MIVAQVVTALAAVVILVVTGMAWAGNRNLFGGITISQALEGSPGSTGGDQNILIMGLDSRLDEHGQPLPQDMYNALHAGDETAGGYNANVLIVVHIPDGTGPITAISIPRDDYVELAGCPTSGCEGKIKQAYGLAYQRVMDSIDASSYSESDSDPTVNEQKAREAGRKAQISTVRNLLGIPIDHFIEVTLVAFFQIAQVVQPITVCLNEATYDSFSGADFHKGVQQIDAGQAMAFVRQRRDVNDEMFTDLDRTRRQQAFIVSLLSALRHGGSLSSPSDLRQLLDVARQNIAVDSALDLSSFVQQASALTDRGVSLYTLPITSFSQDSSGEDINTIDVPTIRSIVHNLVAGDLPDTASTTSSTTAPSSSENQPLSAANGVTLDVVNASQVRGPRHAGADRVQRARLHGRRGQHRRRHRRRKHNHVRTRRPSGRRGAGPPTEPHHQPVDRRRARHGATDGGDGLPQRRLPDRHRDEHKHADHDSSGHAGRNRVGHRDRNANSRAH